jgi:hypothetical protein
MSSVADAAMLAGMVGICLVGVDRKLKDRDNEEIIAYSLCYGMFTGRYFIPTEELYIRPIERVILGTIVASSGLLGLYTQPFGWTSFIPIFASGAGIYNVWEGIEEMTKEDPQFYSE